MTHDIALHRRTCEFTAVRRKRFVSCRISTMAVSGVSRMFGYDK
jgi:hypothetical protein